MKSGGIFAENLSKTGWSGAVSQDLIRTGKRSELLTRTATTEGALLWTPTKSSARLSNLRDSHAMPGDVVIETHEHAGDFKEL